MASWEYSLDAGSTWATGTGTAFELVADTTYAVGDIQVRQSDAAGNVSAAKSNSAEIQTLSPIAPPTFALHADTGSSDTDNTTKDATVDVTLLELRQLAGVTVWMVGLIGRLAPVRHLNLRRMLLTRQVKSKWFSAVWMARIVRQH